MNVLLGVIAMTVAVVVITVIDGAMGINGALKNVPTPARVLHVVLWMMWGAIISRLMTK